MKFSAQAIADLLNGRIQGNANVEADKLSKIEEGQPGSISFLANPMYTNYIYSTNASIVIVNKDLVLTAPVSSTLIRVENVEIAFSKLLENYPHFRNPDAIVNAIIMVQEKQNDKYPFPKRTDYFNLDFIIQQANVYEKHSDEYTFPKRTDEV